MDILTHRQRIGNQLIDRAPKVCERDTETSQRIGKVLTYCTAPQSMQCIAGIVNTTIYAEAVISLDSTEHTIHEIYISPENCVWKRLRPTNTSYVIYTFIVPVLSCFGLCANFINAIVFMRPKMTPSAFSYLAALSCLDCFSCLLILFTALSRSIFFYSPFWTKYDFQWQTPLFGISTGAANLLLGSVSCDRWIYLRHGIANGTGPPRFCRRKVARRVIVMIIFVAVLLNIPYFFIFVVNDDGTIVAHKLYYSTYYKIHNWASFILLTLLPAIFLVIGNIAIIIAFRRWTKQSKKCHGNGNPKTTQKRYHHQMKLTVTIIILIMLYLIGELPAAMTSRKSAVNLLFGGDISRVDFIVMARLEMICLILNSFQLSMNILVYAFINPSFMPELFDCLRGASDVCCNILCLAPLIRCMRRNCCSSKNVNKQSANDEVDCGCEPTHSRKECECESQPRESRKSVRKRVEQCSASLSDSGNGNWDTEPDEAAGVLGFSLCRYWQNSVTTQHMPNHSGFGSERGSHEQCEVWTTDVTWKRSSSFGEYAFDNLALQVSVTSGRRKETGEEDGKHGDESTAAPHQAKRHSLAI
ncbi:uncharacterized protein LOC128867233 [Anastrepha ludens]|uniref:uncharacterized protein LOC128867233 n=1 Tax=Anastrepha ludens TaxID=28586 RepID=UPI0023B104F2|nr:uncharacterized protein LOC128867233 [Anastrepha ludens]